MTPSVCSAVPAIALALLIGCTGNLPKNAPEPDAGNENGVNVTVHEGQNDQKPDEPGDDGPSGDGGAPFAPNDSGLAPDASITPPEVPLDAGAPEPEPEVPDFECRPAISSEQLPARSSVMSGAASNSGSLLFTSELFNAFYAHCGGCHVDTSLGDYQVTFATFADQVDEEALERMQSDDPDVFMPPTASQGSPFSERPAGDPIRVLVDQLRTWIDAGKPDDVVFLDQAAQSTGDRYVFSEDLGMGLTNIGNCVPGSSTIGALEAEASDLDERFAAMTELPERLEETDLVSFDSEQLALQRVVAFAPGYPLWSDDAGKLRHVRVPMGESIHFDAETQNFDIPPNTRLYKTFLKKVVDSEGKERFRKIETRLIVARPDVIGEDGTVQQTALFGSYAWSEDEREATLVRDPLRNGQPFADRMLNVVLDEVRALEVIAENPDNLERALEDEQLIRRYAIPGSIRCIQCHMGSPSKDFVLGFTPLQMYRRPAGEGGVIEPSMEHELDQLQRFIKYGIVTGLDDTSEVTLLENSQGQRKPRTEHELVAQGYMVGNCAHCHNPRGFPTVTNPVLLDLLDFLPSKAGGVFEFPLDRYSPRIRRGVAGSELIPYITPSLHDRPATQLDSSPPKSVSLVTVDGHRLPSKTVWAPWRSLIYRNVDTPFTYSDDFAMFPHMPLHVPGFDCRAPRIMAEWMTSIPSTRIPEIVQGRQLAEWEGVMDQPYEETFPDDPNYARAVQRAEGRLQRYRDGLRYEYCPDTSDIVDPEVVRGEQPVPQSYPKKIDAELYPGTTWDDGVPDRTHWVKADTTNAAGDWSPRRLDWWEAWQSILSRNPDLLDEEEKQVREILDMLSTLRISDELREFALSELPYGLWQPKDDCDFSSVPTVASLQGPDVPSWVATRPTLDPGAPVYVESPGAAMFDTICANCHGAQADSDSNLANTIMQMTGGATRVANLRDGLFGGGGVNRERVFGERALELGIDTDDLAARYVVWMGLGGTLVTIPQSALVVVGNAPVLGEPRTGLFALPEGTPNMLTTARFLCAQALPLSTGGGGSGVQFLTETGRINHDEGGGGTRLSSNSADADVWTRLCSIDNPPPVRVVFQPAGFASDGGFAGGVTRVQVHQNRLYWATSPSGSPIYPADALVGDHEGRVVAGIHSDNSLPWCVERPSDPAALAYAEQWAEAVAHDGVVPPICPEELFQTLGGVQLNQFNDDDIRRWAIRGAMNVGMAVFLYLDGLQKGEIRTPIPYNRCEDLDEQP